MKSNNKIKKISLLIALFAITVIIFNVDFAKQINNAKTDSILSNYSREKFDYFSSTEIELSVFSLNESVDVSNKSKKLLDFLNNDIIGEKTIKKIYNTGLDRITTKIITESSEIDFDVNGDIVKYVNLDDFSTVDKEKKDYTENTKLPTINYEITEKSQLSNMISNIEEKENLQEYTIVDCSNNVQGAWIISWCRKYENGLINPYDGADAVIDAKDGSIMLYGRNTMLPNTISPSISESEAIEYASPIISKYDYDSITVDLTFTRPNFYFEEGGPYEMADFVRLCYSVSIDDCLSVDIDAVTGEILGGSQSKAVQARSMYVELFDNGMNTPSETLAREQALLAQDALSRLGYSQDYGTVYWRITQTDIDWILARTDMYGLYLSCHGDVTDDKAINKIYAITPNGNEWKVNSNNNFGNWHFVYLDACLTSCTNNFANAFHCTDAGECFVGWNVVADVAMTEYFNKRFFARLGSMTVYQAVCDSLWEARAAGYKTPPAYFKGECNICDPGFIGDTNYYGWSW